MIIALYSDSRSSREFVKNRLRSFYGFHWTTVEEISTDDNLRELAEDGRDYVIWDCDILDAQGLTLTPHVTSLNVAHSRERLIGGFQFWHVVVRNEGTIDDLQKNLHEALITIAERTGRAAAATRRGFEHYERTPQ